MDNGCKYSDKKEVKVVIAARKSYTVINFIDQGIGIHPKDLDVVFRPFFRGRNSKSTTGHGIGLALADNIIRLHNGRIEVKSAINAGTTFSIFLNQN